MRTNRSRPGIAWRCAAGWLASALALALPQAAGAQVWAVHPDAAITRDDQPAVGAWAGVAHRRLRTGAWGRFGVTRGVDLGVEGLVERYTGTGGAWRAGAGADVRFALGEVPVRWPVDAAAVVGLGWSDGGGWSRVEMPVGVVASIPVDAGAGRVAVPFAGAFLVARRTSVDTPGGSVGDTSLEVQLRGGVRVHLFDGGDAFASLQVGERVMFAVGFAAGLPRVPPRVP